MKKGTRVGFLKFDTPINWAEVIVSHLAVLVFVFALAFMYLSAAQVFNNAYADAVAAAPWALKGLGIAAAVYMGVVAYKVYNQTSKIKGDVLPILVIAGLLVLSLLALGGFVTPFNSRFL